MDVNGNRDHRGFHVRVSNLIIGLSQDPMKGTPHFVWRNIHNMADFSEPKSESMDLQDLQAREKLGELIKRQIREAFEKAVSQYVFFDYRDITENAENLSLLSAVSHFIPHVNFDWDFKIKGARRWKWGFRKDRLKELLEAIDEAAEVRR